MTLRDQVWFFGLFLILRFELLKAFQTPCVVKSRFFSSTSTRLEFMKQENLTSYHDLMIDLIPLESNKVDIFDLKSCKKSKKCEDNPLINDTNLMERLNCDDTNPLYYCGKIRGINNSSVCLTMCRGVLGFARNGSEMYIIVTALHSNEKSTYLDSDFSILNYQEYYNLQTDSVSSEHFLYLMIGTITVVLCMALYLFYDTCCLKRKTGSYSVCNAVAALPSILHRKIPEIHASAPPLQILQRRLPEIPILNSPRCPVCQCQNTPEGYLAMRSVPEHGNGVTPITEKWL